MEIVKTGFILYTLNYEACLHFYEQVIGLKILYRKETLTCFDFFGSYLMVEIDDETEEAEVSHPDRDRTCIRMNVPNVKAVCERLDAHSIPYTYGEFEWGTVAKLRDPDGNLVGFRSVKEHASDARLNH